VLNIARIYRSKIEDGFVDVVILQETDSFVSCIALTDGCQHDGWHAFRKEDITNIKRNCKALSYVEKALELNTFDISNPIDRLDSFEDVIKVAQEYPLICFERGYKYPDEVAIGMIESVSETSYQLKYLGVDAKFDNETEIIKKKHITSVSFGSLYLNTLAQVLGSYGEGLS